MAVSGRLSEDGMALALDSLRRFAALIRAMGVRRVDAVATAAVRDTANGAAFVAEIKRCCGLDVTVLSGNREARLRSEERRVGKAGVSTCRSRWSADTYTKKKTIITKY